MPPLGLLPPPPTVGAITTGTATATATKIGSVAAGAITGAAASIIADLIFPKTVADGTIPPELIGASLNDATQTGGGNPQSTLAGLDSLTEGENYVISGTVVFKSYATNSDYESAEVTRNFSLTLQAPFSEPFYWETPSGTNHSSQYKIINSNGNEQVLVYMAGIGNPNYGTEVIDFNYTITTAQGDPALEEVPDFDPNPNPNPDLDDDLLPPIDPNLFPELPPLTGFNPPSVPETDPPLPQFDPPPTFDPDLPPNFDPIIIEKPVPYKVPYIVPVPSPPQIITVKEPFILEKPVFIDNPIVTEKPKTEVIVNPQPPVPPTQCDPCCVCEEPDLSEIMDLINDILEELNNSDEIDWSEIKDYIDEKLECHEPSFKAIISNQKINRLSILSTMNYSIHNALMLSYDVDSSSQYSFLAPSTQSATTFTGYCGESEEIDYGTFVSEINDNINKAQVTIDYTDEEGFSRYSMIITAASGLWKVIVTGFQSIKNYCSLLINQISSIGNSLKYSKVVNDSDYEYMSNSLSGLTVEQKAYDLGLSSGDSSTTIFSSVANVVNPMSDADVWQEFAANVKTLDTNIQIDKATILDEITEINDSLSSVSYPEFIMPEIMD